ncbi:MAG: NAD(P)H-dependent oxidoreductase [Elusimicrobia bacterium CG11_big_fil_rev_8_21_14_0_20_64_6]|nr:MAG: NAD(P)H-dependent oxidoreductase [Elusimicrobia bacterium CG11_big_fil_rev_8_21_14_0_20_64_6]
MNALNQTALPETLLSALNWRYAVKKFDAAGRIPLDKWEALEESLVLSPSSYGLQAWKFLVVEDKALRARLLPHAWDQSQIVDADKLVVFLVKKDAGADDVQRFVDRISEVRRLPAEMLEGYKQVMLKSVSRPPEKVEAWLTRQVYIALGNFLTSAALLGVDACPMEGFDKDEFDKILGLHEQGWKSVVIAAAGVRAADDGYATSKKVRFPRSEVVAKV